MLTVGILVHMSCVQQKLVLDPTGVLLMIGSGMGMAVIFALAVRQKTEDLIRSLKEER